MSNFKIAVQMIQTPNSKVKQVINAAPVNWLEFRESCWSIRHGSLVDLGKAMAIPGARARGGGFESQW